MLQIIYVDIGSTSYVQTKHKCEFIVSSVKGSKNWGYLESPVHSLPPNTTCTYHFQGRRHQNVWLSFVKYHAASWDPNAYHLELECNAKLTILDGPTKAPNGQLVSVSFQKLNRKNPNANFAHLQILPKFSNSFVKYSHSTSA